MPPTRGGYGDALPRAVAINYAKLLAYKDEYEVARLFTDGTFRKAAARPVRGRVQVQLQPRAADSRRRRRCAGTAEEARLRFVDDAGVPDAREMRFLRGTPLDIFGYSADRKLERDLIAGYEKDVATVLGLLSPANARHRDRDPVVARPHPRLRPGEGEGGAGRQGPLRPARRRSRQPAARAEADQRRSRRRILMVS